MRIFYFTLFFYCAPCANKAQREILDLHNSYREKHGAKALEYNDTLAQQSQEWALHLRDNNNCQLQHGGQFGSGQNLAGGYLTWTAAIEAFYEESVPYQEYW